MDYNAHKHLQDQATPMARAQRAAIEAGWAARQRRAEASARTRRLVLGLLGAAVVLGFMGHMALAAHRAGLLPMG